MDEDINIEFCICEACGRDFVVDGEAVGNPAYRQFCPACRSPYLLEDENDG